MSTSDEFLQSIIADPENDGLRLIYADWLEENGDPERAEFIRAQIELAQRTAHFPPLPKLFGRYGGDRRASAWMFHWEPDLIRLAKRAHVLWQRHHRTWLQELPPKIVEAASNSVVFERGLPSGIRLTGELFLQHGSALLDSAPIERLTFYRLDQSYKKCVSSPLLERIRGLVLRGYSGWEQIMALGQAPYLHNLRKLVIAEHLDAEEVQSLAEAPWAENITELELRSSHVAGAMTETTGWKQLQALHLTGYLNQEDIEALAETPATKSLRTLDLTGSRCGPEGMVALAQSEYLKSLQALGLCGNHITLAGIEALCASDWQLTFLDLQGNRLTDAAAKTLADWQGLSSIVSLTLSGNRIRKKGWKTLAKSTYWDKLRHLEMGSDGEDAAIAELFEDWFDFPIAFSEEKRLWIESL